MNLGRLKDFNRYVYIASRIQFLRGQDTPTCNINYLLKYLIRPKFIFVNKLIQCRKLILRKNSIFLSQIDTHFFAANFNIGFIRKEKLTNHSAYLHIIKNVLVFRLP